MPCSQAIANLIGSIGLVSTDRPSRPTSCTAQGDGHQIICLITEERLAAEAHAAIDELLGAT